MSRRTEDETTVNDRYSVTVPASVRQQADVESGDKLRWRVDENGELSVEVLKQRRGAFTELESIDIGEETNVAGDHDQISGDT